MTTVPLDLAKVQIYTWPRDAFVLGIGILGTDRLTATGPAWTDVLGQATGLRFNRGGKIAGPVTALDVGRLTLNLVNGCDPATAPVRILPNRPIRVLTAAGTKTAYTGTLESVRVTHPDTDHTLVTLTAADAIKSLAQVKAVPDAVPNETVYSRLDKLLTGRAYTKLVPWYAKNLILDATPNWLPDWGNWGGAQAPTLGITSGVNVAGYTTALTVLTGPYSGNKTITAYEAGITYPLNAFTAGASYVVTMTVYNRDTTGLFTGDFNRYAIGIDQTTGDQWGESVIVPAQQAATLTFAFRATKGYHTIKLAKAFTGIVGDSANTTQWNHTNLYVLGLTVTMLSQPGDQLLPLAGCALEDTLPNHLDLAANSAGLDWWINKTNTITFRRRGDHNASPLILSDQHNPAHINYLTDIDAAYDTTDVTNTLELRNHTIGPDGKDLVTTATFTDPTSITLYGARGATIDTSIPVTLLPARAAQDLNPTPAFIVSSLSVDALAYPAICDLELMDDVQVIRASTTTTYRVVGIEHNVTQTRWKVTLTLRKET